MVAAAGGHDAMVRLLLQSGAEVNAADEVMRPSCSYKNICELDPLIDVYKYLRDLKGEISISSLTR